MNGIKKIKLAALNSNIFIYNLEKNPHYTSATDTIFTRLMANKLKGITSIITLTEILSYPKTEPVAKQLTDDFFSTPNLEVLDIGPEIAFKAAEIRRKYKIKLPDAIQLATALVGKAQVFITNDNHLKTFQELKIITLSGI